MEACLQRKEWPHDDINLSGENLQGSVQDFYLGSNSKKFLTGEVTSHLRAEDCPHKYKNYIYLTISIINKCFEFENDWLKIICIRYKCTQFCPIPLSRNSKKMCNYSAPWCSMCTKLLSTNYYATPTLYVKFGEILCSRTGDNENPKVLRKCCIITLPSGRFALKYS